MLDPIIRTFKRYVSTVFSMQVQDPAPDRSDTSKPDLLLAQEKPANSHKENGTALSGKSNPPSVIYASYDADPAESQPVARRGKQANKMDRIKNKRRTTRLG